MVYALIGFLGVWGYILIWCLLGRYSNGNWDLLLDFISGKEATIVTTCLGIVVGVAAYIGCGKEHDRAKRLGYKDMRKFDADNSHPVSAVIISRESETKEYGTGSAIVKYAMFGPLGLLGHRQSYSTRYYTTFEVTYMTGRKQKHKVEDYSEEYHRYMSVLNKEKRPITYYNN